MVTSNAHTHTCFCDGANTPEEMVQAALAKGFRVLGFSGHGDTPFDHSYAMSAEKTASYLQELKRLQKQYAGQIHIVIGMEADLFSHVDTSPYQYLIGSCHYVKSPSGKYYAVDNTKEELALAITEGFSGDPKAMVSQYYENVAAWLSRGTFQILGHFDLVRKFNAQNCLFDAVSYTHLGDRLRGGKAPLISRSYGKGFDRKHRPLLWPKAGECFGGEWFG